MKKSILFFILFIVIFQGLYAQDTISRVSPRYYVNHPHWTDDTLRLDTMCRTRCYYFSANAYGETAKRCYAKDSLKVYGVAAALHVAGITKPHGPHVTSVIDTTYDSVCEYFRLYKQNTPGNLDVIAETQVCALDSIVGYLMFEPQEYLMGIYESYFEEGPITVKDTFFVGFTQYLDRQTVVNDTNKWLNWRMLLGMGSFQPLAELYITEEERDLVWRHSIYSDWYTISGFYYIFPIYNPEEYNPTPDDPEPNGIDEEDGLARYVSVSPNPARTEAKVVSSFPIKQVEAFDANGRRVSTLEGTGPVATLDVCSWPTGTYVLKISTSVGLFSKKLVVE